MRPSALKRMLVGPMGAILLIGCGVVTGCSAGLDHAGGLSQIQPDIPSFYPEPGTYTSPQKVTLTDSSVGVTIYYTTDGTTPTSSSKAYSGTISVDTSTTIKALAVSGSDSQSPVASAPFILKFPVAPAPALSVAPGAYTTSQTVALTSNVPGAEIHFTSDGSTPSANSTLYVHPLVLTSSATIRAVTIAYGFQQSEECDASYTINYAAAATPILVPPPGTYTTSQDVAITTSTPNATIYYTTDGSIPSSASPNFRTAITVHNEGSTTIKALVTAPDFNPSTILAGTYDLKFPVAPAPTTLPAAGIYASGQSVVLADAAPGASIFYTLDGTTPTLASTRYTAPIVITTSADIRAIATAPNFTPSPIVSSKFSFPAQAPVITPVAGVYTRSQSVTMASTTTGSSIFYTLDGSDPTAASSLYTSAISVSANAVVKAVALSPDFTLSSVTTATYTIYAKVPDVTISPKTGSYNGVQKIQLSDVLAGTTIYYTLDGSAPTLSSSLYTAPISVGAAGLTTVNAFATYAGLPESAVSSAAFTLTFPISGPPTYTYKSVQVVGGGFVDGLYFHPAQQGLMYAHTDIGGAYRWNAAQGGDAQWMPLNDSIGRFHNGFDLAIQSLAIDPGDASRLYLAVGAYTESFGTNGAILASSDMGKTFTPTALPFKNGGNDSGRNDGDRLVVDPNNGRHLYLGTFYNGLYESLDRAVSWKQVSAFPITGITSNPEDPEVGVIFEQFVASSGIAANGNTKGIYYGVSSPTRGLYVSQDGGATFASVPGQPTGYYPNAQSFDAVNNILYVTYAVAQGCSTDCGNGGVINPNAGQVWSYRLPTTSAPNGTWKNITPPQTIPAGGSYGYNSVAVDPSHPNIIVVTTLNKYYPDPYDDVFRSTDSGTTWFNINSNVAREISIAPWVSVFEPGNWFNHFVIDPFDSNHALYGNGETIWTTNDLESADGVATSTNLSVHGNLTHWAVGAQGIEETAVQALVSPPSGPAHLLSQMYDLGGFTHTDVDTSPSTGQQKKPLFTTGTSIDFAQSNPLFVVRVGQSNGTAGTVGQGPGSLRGAYSRDGGLTWAPFASDPVGLINGAGTVAVSADGAAIVWMPADNGMAAAFTTDAGTTWKASAGGPIQTISTQVPGGYIQVYADRVNPKKFYLFDSTGTNGKTPIYISTDGGRTYTLAATPANYDTGFAVSPSAEGDIWMIGYNGLYRSTNSGATITQISGVENSFGIAFGAPAPTTVYPAIYFVGHLIGDTACAPSSSSGFTVQTQCVYRSTDAGKTFLLINDFEHQYGSFNVIAGDPRVFGRVYFGTNGRGIIQADSPN